jgi:hypothetical protein
MCAIEFTVSKTPPASTLPRSVNSLASANDSWPSTVCGSTSGAAAATGATGVGAAIGATGAAVGFEEEADDTEKKKKEITKSEIFSKKVKVD